MVSTSVMRIAPGQSRSERLSGFSCFDGMCYNFVHSAETNRRQPGKAVVPTEKDISSSLQREASHTRSLYLVSLAQAPAVPGKTWYPVLKRLLDIVAATVLLLLLSPLLLIVALVIKVTSPGPAILVQERTGKGEDAGKVLDSLGYERYCCRRMFVSHTEVIDDIMKHKRF